MNSKKWLLVYLLAVLAIFFAVGGTVFRIDPFFHYHAPLTDEYRYPIDNQRSMNDGLIKNLEYDALITGTSLTENFKTSEFDSLFGTTSIKVPVQGGSFYETNTLINTGLEHNPELKTVLRGLDISKLCDDSDGLRTDLGVYPTYLYDDNPLNDYKYLLNRHVFFTRVFDMTEQRRSPDFEPGLMSFDEAHNWMDAFSDDFGNPEIITESGYEPGTVGEPVHLSEKEREIITNNIMNNVVSTAQAHPDVTFYYFFTPYSAAWWLGQTASGEIWKTTEAEELAAELMLQCDNIRLFDFSVRTDITTDLNNYKDFTHYGEWVNSMILQWICADEYRLTGDNYRDCFSAERDFYLNYDFGELSEKLDKE